MFFIIIKKLIKKYFHSTVFVLILFIIGITPIIIYKPMMWEYVKPKELYFKFLSIIAIVFQLIQIIIVRKSEIKLNYLDIFISIKPIIFLILYLFLNQYYTLPIKIDILIYLTAFYWLIQASFCHYNSLIHIKKYIMIILFVIFSVCILEALLGILQFLNFIPFKGSIIYKSVVIGTFGNTNSLGGFLASSILLILGLYYFFDGKLTRLIITIGIIFIIFILILTKSRGAWLSFFCGIIIYNLDIVNKLWHKFKRPLFKIITTIVLSILLVFLIYLLYSMNEASSLGRIFIWKVTLLMIKDYPIFGIGYGNYPIQYLEYQSIFFQNTENFNYIDHASNVKQAHNEYFQTLSETGIIGFLILIMMIVCFYYFAYKLMVSKNNFIRQFGRIFMASATVILIHSLVDSPLHVLPIYMLFIINFSFISLLSKSISINKLNYSRPYIFFKTVRLKQYYIYPIIFIFFILFTYGIQNIFNDLEGYTLWKKGVLNARSDNWKRSIQYYCSALKYIPNNGELHFHLAGAYVMNQQYNEAVPEFEKAKTNFNDKNIYLSQGIAFQELNNFEYAEKNYLKVISMYPNLLFPRYLLGKMYIENNKEDKAKLALKKILLIDPKIRNDNSILLKMEAAKLLKKINNTIQ